MARKFLVPIDLALNEVRNALAHVLGADPGSPTAGQFWYRSDTGTLKFRDGVNSVNRTIGRLDQIDAPTAAVAMNSQRITGLGDPSGAQDAVTLSYMQAYAMGARDWKESARVVATTNVATLAGGAPNVVDGVTLVANDRVLVTGQSTASQNGLYTVTTAGTGSNGTWTRAADADTSAEVTSGMAVRATEGTANGDSLWFLTTDDPITLGTTALAFAKLSSGGSGTVVKYSANVGDGSSTSIAVTHSLATLDVIVQVFQVSDGAQVEPDITRTSTSVVTLGFTTAPTTNQYRVVVMA